MAPSMAPTVPRTHPARPLTVPGRVQPRKRKEQQKRVARCACSCRAEPALGFATGPESSRAWAMPVVLTGTLRAVAMRDVGSGSCRCLRLHKKRPARLLLLLIFFFLLRGWRQAPGACQRPGGWVGRGVRGMDAAAKPPGTGSRRPRPTHLPGQPPGNRLSATNQTTHEGLRRWLEFPRFVSRKLKIRKHSAAIPQSSACNRSSLAFVTFQSGSTR